MSFLLDGHEPQQSALQQVGEVFGDSMQHGGLLGGVALPDLLEGPLVGGQALGQGGLLGGVEGVV